MIIYYIIIMPLKYILNVGKDIAFEGYLHSMRCKYKNDKNIQCKRNVLIGQSFCHSNLLIVEHLVIDRNTDGIKNNFSI